MANRPTGVDEAIEFVWNQPDTVLQSSEKQSLSAILAKETDVVARRYFLAPLGWALSRSCLHQEVIFQCVTNFSYLCISKKHLSTLTGWNVSALCISIHVVLRIPFMWLRGLQLVAQLSEGVVTMK